ncbi:MAG: glycosyltransferase [Candidatus Kaiserbacteria bacterium]|nr:MAG: glycosyltransferase [Candidatus Kaiserbacteria bacterium]
MRVDICIPAYNEAAIIAKTCEAVKEALLSFPHRSRIIVVDNGSTDETAARALSTGVEVISIPTRGKGAAVVEAARRSDADLFGFIDADLSADPRDIPALLSGIQNDECDVAVGSRLLDLRTVERGWFRTLSSRLFNLLRRLVLGISIADTQCGLKFMNEKGRDLLARCEEAGWFFDLEFLARCELAGVRVREVPIHWSEQLYPGRESKLNMARDGLGAIMAMMRIRAIIGSTNDHAGVS